MSDEKCPRCGCTETRQEGDCPAGNWWTECARCHLPVIKWDRYKHEGQNKAYVDGGH